MKKYYKVPNDVLEAVFNFLQEKPHKEVSHLILGLQRSILVDESIEPTIDTASDEVKAKAKSKSKKNSKAIVSGSKDVSKKRGRKSKAVAAVA